jgi:hypothetical protein
MADASELARKDAARARIVAAVALLAEQCEQLPTVNEYFAWRAANDRSLPSLGTTYRLFPGGWASVLQESTGRNREVRSIRAAA